MRKFSTLLAGLAGLALVAGAPYSSQAQEGSSKSWGPKHTTFWSSDATGTHDPGKFMPTESAPPAAVQPVTQPGQQQQLYYQPQGKRVRSQQRVRQPQTRLRQQQPGTKPPTEGTKPPAERSDQPPADAKPSAPPSQGQQQPTTPGAPK